MYYKVCDVKGDEVPEGLSEIYPLKQGGNRVSHTVLLLEPWLGPTYFLFVSVFLIWTLFLYAQTNLAYLLLCP